MHTRTILFTLLALVAVTVALPTSTDARVSRESYIQARHADIVARVDERRERLETRAETLQNRVEERKARVVERMARVRNVVDEDSVEDEDGEGVEVGDENDDTDDVDETVEDGEDDTDVDTGGDASEDEEEDVEDSADGEEGDEGTDDDSDSVDDSDSNDEGGTADEDTDSAGDGDDGAGDTTDNDSGTEEDTAGDGNVNDGADDAVVDEGGEETGSEDGGEGESGEGGTGDTPVEGKVLITEVLFNPGPTELQGTDTNNEWIEVYNGTHETVDIVGWSISDGAGADVLATQSLLLPAGEYLVITRSATTDDFWTYGEGAVMVHLEATLGSNGLTNSGESVLLYDSEGVVLDAVSWGDDTTTMSPAVDIADIAEGESIARIDHTSDTDTAVDWGVQATPTPGA